ncbi:DMT family transporter [Candidatus Thorarchaeota archaeon]|nr:MAG: DMT family transporter [Candidatus Thorarchaeota archaeon]
MSASCVENLLISWCGIMDNEVDIEPGDSPRVALLLVLSVSMVSSASILIRFSESPPLVIVFWRTLLGAVLMASIGLLRGDYTLKAREAVGANWKWFVAIGLFLCLHFSAWFTSLFLTTVAASVVLTDSSPIFTALLSTFVLKEELGRKSWSGILLAVAGAVFLAWSDLISSGYGALGGDLLALLSALFLALYFIGGRKFAQGIPITVYTSVVYITASGFTLILCFVQGINVIVLDQTELLLFLALAIFPTVLGHSVNNYLLTLVPAYVVSAAVLGEPVGATLLAAVFLNEIPLPITFVGFVVILVGIALVLADLAGPGRKDISALDNAHGS